MADQYLGLGELYSLMEEDPLDRLEARLHSPLPRILTTDGIIDEAKRRRYYEKPCRKRIRENYENCRRIYNTEMARKLAFLMRKNRQDPWLGC
ncbi:28S ribosomal protein S21, mitochondrial [Rhincodon typus]|uniref:28S ribosomal protein S21, mitochondrial n=1 Tax=Rhincodon typus TaxID=259920 RepID=UPI00202E6048|nr:28S ribosomal protein S21, mitochondrial [Rhincodon typus]